MTTPSAAELETYKNHSRVLLVFAPSAKDESYLEQKRLLGDAETGLRERDVVVLEPTGKTSQPFRDRFDVFKSFTVVLIGKDGGEKERFLELVQPALLFGVIDQMPMRRREIKKGQ